MMASHICLLSLLLTALAPLQAMVLLSPPEKEPTSSEIDQIMASLDQKPNLLHIMAEHEDLLVNSYLSDDVDDDKEEEKSVEGEGAETVVPFSQMDPLPDREDDVMVVFDDADSEDAEDHGGLHASRNNPRRVPDHLPILPAPERIPNRSRRSARRPPKSSLRIGVHKSQRRRSRHKNKRRGRIGKRGGKGIDAKIELLVVVENSIFRRFLASNQNNRQAALARIRRYYGMVVAMMDQRFHTIEDRRLSISVSISGIVVAETREDSGWLEKLVDWSKTTENNGRASVNTDKALLDFAQWIKAHHSTLPKFDHAMVFSGYRLTNKYDISFGVAGKAYLGAICDIKNGNSVSIVSDTSDFQCVKVATHELAHSLGSVHDGDPGFESCPAKGNYVMAPVATYSAEKLRNAFFFSRCSVKQMKKLLRSKKAACVRDEPTVYYKYDLQRMPPGQIISPDQHCQMIYGPKSTFCDEYDVKVVVCGQLWCRDPNMNGACRTNSYLTALPGTPCKKGMSCHLGECLANSVIQERTSSRKTPSSSSPSSPSSSSSSGRVIPGSTQSRLSGGRGDLDNTIPTVPQSVIRGRVGRPESKSGRDQSHSRRSKSRSRSSSSSGRRKSRPRSKSRRRGRCKANQPDINVAYCRGLVMVNPEACKRRAIKNYCCRTCAFRR